MDNTNKYLANQKKILLGLKQSEFKKENVNQLFLKAEKECLCTRYLSKTNW